MYLWRNEGKAQAHKFMKLTMFYECLQVCAYIKALLSKSGVSESFKTLHERI